MARPLTKDQRIALVNLAEAGTLPFARGNWECGISGRTARVLGSMMPPCLRIEMELGRLIARITPEGAALVAKDRADRQRQRMIADSREMKKRAKGETSWMNVTWQKRSAAKQRWT